VSRFVRFNLDCWKEHGCSSCTDAQSVQGIAPSSSNLQLFNCHASCTHDEASYRNTCTTDTLVVATLSQSLHSILEKYTNLSSQRDTEGYMYRGADKSLARTGRKQARNHVRDARDFNNIETRAVKFFFPCKARRRRKFTPFCQNHHSSLNTIIKEWGRCWKSNGCSATQQNAHRLWNWDVQYCI